MLAKHHPMAKRYGAVKAALAGVAIMLASTGVAHSADTPFGGLKHDSSQPIEIVSDSLEVSQADQIAVFSGSVEAKQGTMVLTSDRLDVYFDQDSDGSQSAGAAEDETGAIRRVVAVGSVFLTNGAESAKGERADYDVETGKIKMTGDVILTQGANAIRGEVLNIDLNTGFGKVEGSGGGRVQSVFQPGTAE